uniref:Forkhead box N1 n=1 Tax=Neogobius melanostomus TaxID=47308 RepID=A0A8C6SBX9_9GOBI
QYYHLPTKKKKKYIFRLLTPLSRICLDRPPRQIEKSVSFLVYLSKYVSVIFSSILIFMALKNSKTGSLPVSEIYSFMTEHFPYFKTAPDGWKNSVRHNLSLNKCFEKVENKNGSSSRKGCLWALNPAKVDKMQEELHKWRRKDPGTVRRSMAKPEDLDRLLGERPNRFRSLAHFTILPDQRHSYTSSSCYGPEQLSPPSSSHLYPESLYLTHSAPRPNHSFSLPRCLNSAPPGKMAPAYSVAPGEGHSGRGMQDLLMEGDACCDIDTLNPSLTDLQLQGTMWEELNEDSVASDPQAVSSSEQSSYMSPVSQTSEGMVGQDKTHYVNNGVERLWGLDQNSLNSLNSLGQFFGVESVAGGLSSSATSVSLM